MNHHDNFLDVNDETDQYQSRNTTAVTAPLSGRTTNLISAPKLFEFNNNNNNNNKYAKCLFSGAFASSVRWVLTPFDNVKCKMQVEPSKYPTFVSGLRITWQRHGTAGLYRGLSPTVLAYASQTGTKYMMYEVFKDSWFHFFGPEFCHSHKNAVYILSAAGAEAIADVAMAPWEMIKVKVQTTPNFPSRLVPALATMLRDRRQYQFPFGALRPLWTRQIIGTVANFYTFECVTEYIYCSNHSSLLPQIFSTHDDKNTSSGKLVVTCVAGSIAGVVSAVISHPFDVMVSLRTQYPNQAMWTTIEEYGWMNLFTRGLGPRVGLTSSILCVQWLLYDSCRTLLGMPTSGAASGQLSY